MLSACDYGNPAYRPTDPREGQGDTLYGKCRIFRGGDGESLVMVRIRIDWTLVPDGRDVTVYVLDPLPSDADDVDADLLETAYEALENKSIAEFTVVRSDGNR